MEYKILKSETTNGVCLLTISRPAAMNALNSAFFTEFDHFLDNLSKNVKVLVITGEGKAFVAGADISEMAEMDQDEAYSFSKTGQDALDRLENLGIPVIAAVNGYALGSGCELSMAADFRIASKLAKFGQPELNLGLIPGHAGTQRLTRLIGTGNALYLILTCETINAEEAYRIGLVQKLTEPENLLSEAMAIAGKIAANGSQAALKAKRTIRSGTEMSFYLACESEAKEFADLFNQPATKEGMKAFLGKRKPEW
ncbi:MAG: enoyl-CoA hydratase-related protein [Bacteroidia bacterium]|nr:enoyl-CoA hydratase-related protein [Bacteroidia bacterium]